MGKHRLNIKAVGIRHLGAALSEIEREGGSPSYQRPSDLTRKRVFKSPDL